MKLWYSIRYIWQESNSYKVLWKLENEFDRRASIYQIYVFDYTTVKVYNGILWSQMYLLLLILIPKQDLHIKLFIKVKVSYFVSKNNDHKCAEQWTLYVLDIIINHILYVWGVESFNIKHEIKIPRHGKLQKEMKRISLFWKWWIIC